jgi:3-dehydroquinate dehydratase-2
VARVLVVYGPNLNLLGEREPDVYGRETLEQLNARLRAAAAAHDLEVEFFQSNSEGAIIDRLHAARGVVQAVVLNPGALAHSSYALRDAIAAIGVPVVEVHMTNIHAREPFRRRSVLAPVCAGVVLGFGAESFVLGLQAAVGLIRRER